MALIKWWVVCVQVMMLWVNLIMDTMGALALGTEEPTPDLLERYVSPSAFNRVSEYNFFLTYIHTCLFFSVVRRPYKRSAQLLSRPMLRNIFGQSAWQLAILFFLLYRGPDIWGFEDGNYCKKWVLGNQRADTWTYNGQPYTCASFNTLCASYGSTGKSAWTERAKACPCYLTNPCGWSITHPFFLAQTGECYSELLNKAPFTEPSYETTCELLCTDYDYTHYTFIFTAFVMCQVFNEFNARELFNNYNVFRGLQKNPIFMFIVLVTIALQILIVELGGKFVKTTSMPLELWGWSILVGFISIPLALFLRIVAPIKEAQSSFFGYGTSKIPSLSVLPVIIKPSFSLHIPT